MLLAALPRHEEPRYVKALLFEEKRDVGFMAEQREVADRKEIRTLSSMVNTLLTIWLIENTGKNCSEMQEPCWEECDRGISFSISYFYNALKLLIF